MFKTRKTNEFALYLNLGSVMTLGKTLKTLWAALIQISSKEKS